MKTAMKKLFSLVLVAVLLVGVMPFQAFAEETSYFSLEIGEYTVDDAFASAHYEGSGTPTEYYVNINGIEYAKGDKIVVEGNAAWAALVVTAVASEPVVEPDVCANCNGAHKTEECTKTYCDKCAAWGDHASSAHCAECGLIQCICCNECGKAECICCDDCGKYPCACTATVVIVINNVGTGKSFEVEAGKNVNEVYAVYAASDLYDGATGPILTLADSSTPVAATEAGKTYWLWLEAASTVTPDPDPEPTSCTCGAELLNGMCTGCYLDMVDCNCGETTTTQKPENAAKVTLNYNYKGAPKSGSVTVSEGDELINVIASIPAPTREGHLFSHWTMDAEGYDLINNETVPAKGVTIYAQWDDDLALGGKLTLSIHLYKDTWADDLENIKKGAKMGDVLDYVDTPVRKGYKFMGWYWDIDCKDAVKDSDKLYKNDTIYAKWDRRLNTNEMMLKIYLNDNTRSVAKIVDLYEYSRDGKITKSEVDKIVKKYYTQASSGDDMDIDGLFTSTTWNNGRYSMRNAEKVIYVEDDVETIVYVMVRDAKAVDSSSSSSATADSSNPKTGDMIYNAVVIMCASAACLATLFYLNKKRAQ